MLSMDCEQVKKVIPGYFQHTASDEEIQAVEEHLCVCHDCRVVLSELMDTPKEESAPSSESTPQEKPEHVSEENLEAAMEEAAEVSGVSVPIEEAPETKPQEIEPPTEDKGDFLAERDKQALAEEPEPVKQEVKEPEPPAQEPEPVKEEVTEPEPSGLSVKEEVEEPSPDLELETGEEDETEDGASYDYDQPPPDKSKVGLVEYICLVVGVTVLGFAAYLLLKG